MATSSASSTCVRCLRSLRVPRQSSHRYSVQQRGLQTSAPLLDFLAPSWQQERFFAPVSRPFVAHIIASSRSIRRQPFSNSASKRVVAIHNPRTDESGKDMLVNITPRAAHRLQAIAETDKNPDLALRVSVESGGCHGFQYLMSLTNTAEADPEEDTIFENEERVNNKKGDGEGEDGYKAKVIMDEPSLELLKGSSVDYTMELIGSQFKVTGIPGAKSSCGCGTSFDIAA